jgi:hypothetical protein
MSKKRTTKTREQMYADALFELLNEGGAILNSKDKQAIHIAFERHFREVQTNLLNTLASMTKEHQSEGGAK